MEQTRGSFWGGRFIRTLMFVAGRATLGCNIAKNWCGAELPAELSQTFDV